jgi:hypothetical protein
MHTPLPLNLRFPTSPAIRLSISPLFFAKPPAAHLWGDTNGFQQEGCFQNDR